MNDNQHRGVRPWCKEQYASAVELLRTTDMTIEEAANACRVSFSGLREHILFYCKDIVRHRADKRDKSKGQKRIGALNGSGSKHRPSKANERKYAEAVRLFRTTSKTQKEIAAETGVSLGSLRHHLCTWHRDAILERRGGKADSNVDHIDLTSTKHYLKSTAAKYADAIERLKMSGMPTAKVASEFGLHPETFRLYLREHHPELHARQGMTKTSDGRVVSRRSAEKYAEAIRLYETTSEDLKSISRRLGLTYNSLGGYVRRNHPDLIERRKNSMDNNRR